jgi:hypothetical protein
MGSVPRGRARAYWANLRVCYAFEAYILPSSPDLGLSGHHPNELTKGS